MLRGNDRIAPQRRAIYSIEIRIGVAISFGDDDVDLHLCAGMSSTIQIERLRKIDRCDEVIIFGMRDRREQKKM